MISKTIIYHNLDEYPYQEYEGVGLHFIGFPNDLEQFNWILNKEGCHPKAAQRILDRLTLYGEDKLTVMYRLNFNWIKEELSKVGVTMIFISPNVFEAKDDGPWPEELMDKIYKSNKVETKIFH